MEKYKPASIWFLQQFNRPIAHRGLWNDTTTENTLEAIAAAADAGLPVEFDVRLTADNQVVVYHDTTTERVSNVDSAVDQLTLAELKAAGIPTGGTVPSLQEALQAIGGRVPILCDVKQEHVPGRLEAAVAETLSDYQGVAAVQSFNPLTVAWFRRHDPGRLRGLITSSWTKAQIPQPVRRLLRSPIPAFYADPDFIAHELADLPNQRIYRIERQLQIPIIGWTLKDAGTPWRGLVEQVIFEGVDPAEIMAG